MQNRKTKTFCPPTGMTLREARKIARQLDIEFTNQFAKEQASGTNMTLSEVWEWYKNTMHQTTYEHQLFIQCKQL